MFGLEHLHHGIPTKGHLHHDVPIRRHSHLHLYEETSASWKLHLHPCQEAIASELKKNLDLHHVLFAFIED